MSQFHADPDLVQRRLATLVRLLERQAAWQSKGANLDGIELSVEEMREWARQCTNIVRSAQPAKPVDQMSDEELLS